MRMKDFIRLFRSEIDDVINAELGIIPDPPPRRNDGERKLWIANNEGLYCLARGAGVAV